MTPHSSSIAFFSSTSSSTVILPSVSSTFAVSVAISFRSSRVCGCSERRRGVCLRPTPPGSLLSPRRRSRRRPPRPRPPRPTSSPARPRQQPPRPEPPRPRPRRPVPPRPRSAAATASAVAARRRGRRRVAACLELGDPGVDQADQVLQRRVQHRGELRQRGDDHPDELSLQDLERRQLGEPLDLVTRDRVAREHAAAQREDLRVLGRVAERLRHRDRHCRRPRRTRSPSGPSSIASNASAPAASAALRVSVFLTTVSFAPCFRSSTRRLASWLFVSPR